MKLRRRKFLHLAAGAAALPAVPPMARAQAYALASFVSLPVFVWVTMSQNPPLCNRSFSSDKCITSGYDFGRDRGLFGLAARVKTQTSLAAPTVGLRFQLSDGWVRAPICRQAGTTGQFRLRPVHRRR